MKYQRLKDLREDKDMKQTEISSMLNIGLSTYQRYEQGKLKIYLETAQELAEFYNVSLDYITGRTNDKRGLTRSELSENETNLINNFRSLSIERQSRLLERMEMFMEEQEAEQARIQEIG